eukprot:GILI01012867.1.p1 GENE.GILI01012867.1~~GILI01012867.1.p1  ORF type:complete len:203 (+),score=28.47 GILI01012867.1:216-824(+)
MLQGMLSVAEVLPGLYIGPIFYATRSHEKLLKMGVTHIINITQNVDNLHPDKFCYLRIPVLDSPTEPIEQYFDQANEFIASAIDNGKRIYVHCEAGVSRSATIVIQYLMTRLGYTLEDAYYLVKEKRSCIAPNWGFFKKLCELEEQLYQTPSMNYIDYLVVCLKRSVPESTEENTRCVLQQCNLDFTSAKNILLERRKYVTS